MVCGRISHDPDLGLIFPGLLRALRVDPPKAGSEKNTSGKPNSRPNPKPDRKMKTNLLTGTFTALCLILLAACSDYKEKGWYESVPDGGYFTRGNTVRFYYVDEAGNDLIGPAGRATLPIRCDAMFDTRPSLPEDYHEGFYNGNHDCVIYDDEERLYYYSTSAPGDMRYGSYTFYVFFRGEYDRMDMRYKYTNKDVIGGEWAPFIVSWKFNGQHIYSDDDATDRKIFVRKSNGKTTVTVS